MTDVISARDSTPTPESLAEGPLHRRSEFLAPGSESRKHDRRCLFIQVAANRVSQILEDLRDIYRKAVRADAFEEVTAGSDEFSVRSSSSMAFQPVYGADMRVNSEIRTDLKSWMLKWRLGTEQKDWAVDVAESTLIEWHNRGLTESDPLSEHTITKLVTFRDGTRGIATLDNSRLWEEMVQLRLAELDDEIEQIKTNIDQAVSTNDTNSLSTLYDRLSAVLSIRSGYTARATSGDYSIPTIPILADSLLLRPQKETKDLHKCRYDAELSVRLDEAKRLCELANLRVGGRKTPKERKHCEWLVRHQVQGESFTSLERSYPHDRSTVTDGVTEFAQSIELPLRDPNPGGAPKKSPVG